jgi:hypothetical protein
LAAHFDALGLAELPQCHRYEVLMPTRTSAFLSRTFLSVLVSRERLALQAMWWKRREDYAAFYRLSGQKWIHHLDSIVTLAVVQVFGIKCAAT